MLGNLGEIDRLSSFVEYVGTKPTMIRIWKLTEGIEIILFYLNMEFRYYTHFVKSVLLFSLSQLHTPRKLNMNDDGAWLAGSMVYCHHSPEGASAEDVRRRGGGGGGGTTNGWMDGHVKYKKKHIRNKLGPRIALVTNIHERTQQPMNENTLTQRWIE